MESKRITLGRYNIGTQECVPTKE